MWRDWNKGARNVGMATGTEFVTEDEFRWVLGWLIGILGAILSVLTGVIGYMFRRLTSVPSRKEVEDMIEDLRNDLKQQQRDMKESIIQLQTAQHSENSRRLDRMDADLRGIKDDGRGIMDRIQRIMDSAPEIIRRSQAPIFDRLEKLEREK